MSRKLKKKQEKTEYEKLCDGVLLSKEFFEKKESRLLTLLLKGFVVYLLTMGSIGFYLSALDINYNVLLSHIVILVMAFLCAMLYYRLFVENMGYFIMLVAFAGLVYLFRTYINSGFYAIVNITVDTAAKYFDTDIQKLYNEQIANRYVSVTFVVLFIGIVLDIFLNVYISRRMQYVTAFFVVMSLNLIPLYMIYEPDSFYAFMLLAGMALAYVYKSGKHYSPQVSVKRSDNAFELKKKGEELAYVYDVKAMIHMGVLTVILVLAAVVGVNAFKPKEQFNTGYEGNKYKDVTMAAVSTFLIDGWRGFSRHTEDVGGLMGGKLGNVSSVRLDNQTDIVLEMTPYSYDSVYLRGFVGTQYNPYENEWTGSYETKDYDATLETETRALLDYYKDGNEKSAIATLRVINVDLAQNEMCVPYYTWNVSQGSGKYLNINYCPVVEGNGVRVDSYYENQPYSDIDLMVPEENLEAVRSFVEKLGYLGSDEEIIEAVRNYFQEYYPYTIKPGKTPKKEDFVNYFLDDNQKGYCSHFASAATLIFRYLGIPARYVEGYAVSYDSFVDGELVDGQNYEDYYSGFSELGKTALVKVNVTDAEAHAWVEVYDNIRGWHLVDVTPTSDEEEELEDFWTMFENIMGDNTADSVETTDGQDKGLKISDSVVKMIYLAIAVLLMISAAVYLVLFGVKRFRLAIAFKNANINDRLIMKYSAFFRKACRKKSALKECRNYRTQLACIADFSLPGDSRGMDENNGMDSHDRADDNNSVDEQNEIEDILTRAGFSGRMISEGEYNKVIKWLDIHLKQM